MSAFSRWLNRSLGRRIAAMVMGLLLTTVGVLVVLSYIQVLRVTELGPAYGVVRQSRGDISIYSESGRGTTVRAAGSSSTSSTVARQLRRLGAVPGGRGVPRKALRGGRPAAHDPERDGRAGAR